MMETIRSVEEFLAERGEDLSPEEKANLQGALARMKEQYQNLTDSAQSSLAQLDSAISTTLQKETQRVSQVLFSHSPPPSLIRGVYPHVHCCVFKAKAEEELQNTQGKIDTLLDELSSLDSPSRKVVDETDANALSGTLNSHSEKLQVRKSLVILPNVCVSLLRQTYLNICI